MRREFKGSLLVVGGYDREDGNEAIERSEANLFIYGWIFLANPYYPRIFELNSPLNK